MSRTSKMVCYCSFCGRGDYEVDMLIQKESNDVRICDNCIKDAAEMLYGAGLIRLPIIKTMRLRGVAKYRESRFTYEKKKPLKPPS